MTNLPLYALFVLILETVVCMEMSGVADSSENDIYVPSETLQKRQQAWHSYFGKRSSAFKRLPAWSIYYGKRSDPKLLSGNDLSEDQSESALSDIGEIGQDDSNNNKMRQTLINEFGKYDLDNESFDNEAVKRSNFKRLQTWFTSYGKRDGEHSEDVDLDNDKVFDLSDSFEADSIESMQENEKEEMNKRMQGWGSTYGKRYSWNAGYGKRMPGWYATYGKRSPVWFTAYGKRSPAWYATYGKRAPMWQATYGKRAPMWQATYGKRAPMWQATYGKRAPMWQATYGKRAPMWQATYGKRAPMWQATYGKRNSDDLNTLNENSLTDSHLLDTDKRTPGWMAGYGKRRQAWSAMYGR